MYKPNLFDYATSELSHDAFIAWLLKWADKSYQDNQMHQLSRDVITKFFELSEKSVPSITDIDVQRQFHNIDVFAEIESESGEKWAIIIENKIYTSQHSDQLQRYRTTVHEKKSDISENRIIGIYYKMWEQSDMSRVNERGYAHFDRTTMLDLMEPYLNEINNDIFQDYYSYVKTMQEELDAFETTVVSKWEGTQWVGFYSKLKQDLDGVEAAGDNNYGYVPNPSGGFWGYWLGGQKFDNGDTLYLQSEEKKLCFKVHVSQSDKRQHAKWFWHDRVKRTANELGMDVVKPKVMRVGRWFTIGVLNTESDQYWMPTKFDGIIDYPATLKLINQSINLIHKCVDDYGDEYLASLN